MSERPLPPDMSDWPGNPFELLGVGQPYGSRELKKAYTRLIRFYKPELHPVEFARIREAYDRLLPWARDKDPVKPAAEELPPPRVERHSPEESPHADDVILPPPQITVSEQLTGSEFPSTSSLDEFPHRAPEPDSVQLWQQATRGEAGQAYRALTEESARHPSAEKNYLRLFWLLTVHKDLDGERHPADWLVRGLSATGGSQRLLETYATCLALQPLEANSPRCAKIMDSLQDPHQFSFLVQHSWRQLLNRRRWNDVWEQFPKVRDRLRHSTDSWLGLVRVVADATGWETANITVIDLMKACLRELDELSFVALQKPEVFDRIDFLKTLAKSCEAVGRDEVLRDLGRLIRREWTTDLDHVRTELHRLIADIATFPNRWFNRFDGVGSPAHPVACQAYQLVNQLRIETGGEVPPTGDPERQRKIQRELTPVTQYSNYRDTIYEHCLRNYVAPESLVEILSPRYSKKYPQDSVLEEQLLGDWPLRLVCLAHRFFHS